MTFRSKKRGVTPDRVPTISRYGIRTRAHRSRRDDRPRARDESLARPAQRTWTTTVSSTDTTAAEMVKHHDVVPVHKVDQVTPPDPAVGIEPLRWLDQDQRGLEAADAIRIEKM